MIEIKLAKNFWLSEFLKSSTATRLGIDNTPPREAINNLELLALRILQPVRDYFVKEQKRGNSVTVRSGFRCPALNNAIGSSGRSQHIKGSAADFEIMGLDNYEVACWIRDNLEFDQLILEFYTGEPNSGWIHCSLMEHGNRKECLTINKGTFSRGLIK